MATTTDNTANLPTLSSDEVTAIRDLLLQRDPPGVFGISCSPVDSGSVKNATRVAVIVSFDDPHDDGEWSTISVKLGELSREEVSRWGTGRGGYTIGDHDHPLAGKVWKSARAAARGLVLKATDQTWADVYEDAKIRERQRAAYEEAIELGRAIGTLRRLVPSPNLDEPRRILDVLIEQAGPTMDGRRARCESKGRDLVEHLTRTKRHR